MAIAHTLHVDGGARGNPGPAAAGVVLAAQGASILEAGFLLNEQTNNQAEYGALIIGVQAALSCDVRDLRIYSDSELVVRQMTGQYRVAARDLKPLHKDAQRLLAQVRAWHIEHVARTQNTRADELVNLALDCDDDVVEVDTLGVARRLTPRHGAGSYHVASGASVESLAVEVVVARGPAEGCCPGGCQEDQRFLIKHTIPADLCVDAAYAILGVVRRWREQGIDQDKSSRKIMCPRPGCGAFFQIVPQDVKS